MSHSLAPLRRAYGLGEPPPGRAAGADAAEGEMLAQMRRLLEAAPRSRPEPAAVAAVEAHAEAALPFAELRRGVGGSVEAELARQSAAALDALPASSPDAATLDAVLARAAEASAELAPVRAAYRLGDELATGDPVEAELLAQTRAVLDKAWTPQRPSAEAVDAVLARAASWSAEAVGTTTAPSVAAAYGLGAPLGTPEAAVVAGTADALGRLPVHRPSDSALAAVLAAAAAASEAPAASARPAPARTTATPRPPVRRDAALPAALWARRPAVWGGALATLAAVLVVFGIDRGAQPEVAAVQQSLVAEAPAAAPEAEPEAQRAPLPPQPEADPAPSPGAQALAAGGPMAGLPAQASTLAPPVAALAVVPQRRAARATPDEVAPREAAPSMARTVPAPAESADADVLSGAALAAAADATDDAPADAEALWDDADDVRLLSLRLQELRRKNQGLTWDAPAEPFGAPAAAAAGSTPGLQSVGFGAAGAVPRARALVDTTLDR